MRRNDFFLLAGIIFFASILYLIFWLNSDNGSRVIVSVDGKDVATYLLSDDGEYFINGTNGLTDVLVIRNGFAYMKEAACPDKLCIKQGHINKTGQSIVCLPARIVVVVQSDLNSEVDSIAQ